MCSARTNQSFNPRWSLNSRETERIPFFRARFLSRYHRISRTESLVVV